MKVSPAVFFFLYYVFLKFCQNATVQCAKYRQRLSPAFLEPLSHCLSFQVCKEAFGLTEDQHANEFKFMRKGKAGDWKNHFDQETQRKFQNWEQKWLEGTDLAFRYEV